MININKHLYNANYIATLSVHTSIVESALKWLASLCDKESKSVAFVVSKIRQIAY